MSEYDNDTVLSTMRVNFIFPNISHLLWEWTLFSQVYFTYNERELYFRKYISLTAVLILFLSIKLENRQKKHVQINANEKLRMFLT